MPIRVLIVDDHDGWRQRVALIVREEFACDAVGEAADGLTGVEEAVRLQPDLVLMDVGLPKLNGIEAARRILSAHPSSRILFLSQHDSPEIAAAAMETGAKGYVVKSRAAPELVPAIRSILDGQLFIGAGLAGPAESDRLRQTARCHEILFSADETRLDGWFAHAAGAALSAGSSVIVIAGAARLKAVERRLGAAGLDLAGLSGEGRYVTVDADEMLGKIVVAGAIDESLFWKTATTVVAKAAQAARGGHPRVTICGEGAPRLWRTGQVEAAIRLEQLSDRLARTYDVAVFCAYAFDLPAGADEGWLVDQLCNAHSTVRPR